MKEEEQEEQEEDEDEEGACRIDFTVSIGWQKVRDVIEDIAAANVSALRVGEAVDEDDVIAVGGIFLSPARWLSGAWLSII